MKRNTAEVKTVLLLALGSTILLGQLQAAWGVGKAAPKQVGKAAAHGKALGHLKNGKALAAPTETTLPVVAPVTTIPQPAPRAKTSAAEKKKTKRTGTLGAAAAERGTITIKKDAVPDADEEFSFSGDLGRFKLKDEVGLSFSDLKAGIYKVTEKEMAGWEVDHIVCGDPTAGASIEDTGRTVTISLPPGGDTTCTFVNIRTGEDVSGKGEGKGSGKERDPFGNNDKKDPGAKGLPFTGFQPDWFLFAAGMLFISGGTLLRPREDGFSF